MAHLRLLLFLNKLQSHFVKLLLFSEQDFEQRQPKRPVNGTIVIEEEAEILNAKVEVLRLVGFG